MSIQLTETSYIEAFWIIGWGRGDWLATLYRDTPDSPWQAKYRFRYYEGPKVWDGKDRKSWYDLDFTNSNYTAEEITAKFDEVALKLVKQMRQDMPGRSVKLIKRVIRGGYERFDAEFAKTGFAHKLVVPFAKGPAGAQ